ncbi:ATP-grasp domain-containing protein [bacterium]|nr:ATP-grasp domain-containing protein [bacterium]
MSFDEIAGRMEPGSRILIIGASVRAAAQSAVNAGLRPICADLFGDEDLRQIAECQAIDEYPHQFVDWAVRQAQQFGRLPLMYTGGLENYPDTIQRLGELHTLMGNSASVLRRVRDPFWIERSLAEAALPSASNIRHDAEANGRNEGSTDCGKWLVKPLAGSAGFGIRVSEANQPIDAEHYRQQYYDGPTIAAVFVADGERCRLVGTTMQLVGLQSLAAGPFGWCGSFGPIPLRKQTVDTIQRIGDCLVQQSGLEGVFGVDCVLANDTVIPLEVNPRYTGSCEVHERAGIWQLFDRVDLAADAEFTNADRPRQFIGKAIVFARQSVVADNLIQFEFVADRPANGEVIQQHNPVCTVFGQGDRVETCLIDLASRIEQVSQHLFGKHVGFHQEVRRLWERYLPFIE